MFPSFSTTPTFQDIFRMLHQKHRTNNAPRQALGNQNVKADPELSQSKSLSHPLNTIAGLNPNLYQQLQTQMAINQANKSPDLENQSPNNLLNLQTLLSTLQSKLKEKNVREFGLDMNGNQLHQTAKKEHQTIQGKQTVSDSSEIGQPESLNSITNLNLLDSENDPSRSSLLDPKSKKIRKMNQCGHPERSHYAKNMCNQCYHKFGRTKKPWRCNHDRLYAHGLCQNCYINAYNKKRSQKVKEEQTDQTSSSQSTVLNMDVPLSLDNQEPLMVEDKLAFGETSSCTNDQENNQNQ